VARERETLGTFEDIHEAASRAVGGLDDFGSDDYHEGLRLLIDDLTNEAGLTGEGNYMHRFFLRGGLIGRLLAQNAFTRFPEHADVTIERPIFVTGLPRSGTTALHRLLTEDPSHQGLEMWLTELPQPRPPRETWESDPVFSGLQTAFSQQHVENPEFMGIHYIDAASVEECWRLLRQAGKSNSHETLAYVPNYTAWLRKQDWTDAYEMHKRNLQLIGLNDQEKRWVLKNPSHLSALDAIMNVYPDALIVQTHRDPVVCMASSCSLSEESTKSWSTVYQGDVIGRTQLDLWSHSAKKFAQDRQQYDAAQFVDVDYSDFFGDPFGTVRNIYDAFNLDWTPAVEEGVRRLDGESKSGKTKPKHTYSLADYGLTEDEVRAAFAG
jgi:hypothetical protein